MGGGCGEGISGGESGWGGEDGDDNGVRDSGESGYSSGSGGEGGKDGEGMVVARALLTLHTSWAPRMGWGGVRVV